MSNDTSKQVERSRAIFTNLLRALPPVEREKHLTKHAEDLQRSIDGVLLDIDANPPPASGRPRSRPMVPVQESLSIAERVPGDVHAAVERADSATVSGAIRAVLASEKGGLLTRQIVEGVNVLRPDTDATLVSGALHQMRKRGELAREGFHKNYRYRLTDSGSLSNLGSGAERVANDAGGARH